MPATDDTEVEVSTGVAAVRHRRTSIPGRVSLHVASWRYEEPASTVPHNVQTGDLDTAPPPAEQDYLDGDAMVVVAGNHCLVMPSGMRGRPLSVTCAPHCCGRANLGGGPQWDWSCRH